MSEADELDRKIRLRWLVVANILIGILFGISLEMGKEYADDPRFIMAAGALMMLSAHIIYRGQGHIKITYGVAMAFGSFLFGATLASAAHLLLRVAFPGMKWPPP
jgi:hypothetical protein